MDPTIQALHAARLEDRLAKPGRRHAYLTINETKTPKIPLVVKDCRAKLQMLSIPDAKLSSCSTMTPPI